MSTTPARAHLGQPRISCARTAQSQRRNTARSCTHGTGYRWFWSACRIASEAEVPRSSSMRRHLVRSRHPARNRLALTTSTSRGSIPFTYNREDLRESSKTGLGKIDRACCRREGISGLATSRASRLRVRNFICLACKTTTSYRLLPLGSDIRGGKEPYKVVSEANHLACLRQGSISRGIPSPSEITSRRRQQHWTGLALSHRTLGMVRIHRKLSARQLGEYVSRAKRSRVGPIPCARRLGVRNFICFASTTATC